MKRTYNRFDPGVKQDDFLTGGPSFIEHKNVDGLKDGYGITLGSKVVKQLLTSTTPIRGMDGLQLSDGGTSRIYLGGDNGVIYTLDSTDDTPEFTLANGKNIVQVVKQGNNLYFFYKASFTTSNMGCAKILESQASSGNWGAIDENFIVDGSLLASMVPPFLVVGSDVFLGGNGVIYTISGTGITSTETFPDSDVVSLTLQGSTIGVYCESGNTYFWDGGSTTESGRGNLGARGQKAVGLNGQDFVTTEDGQLKTGAWTSFGEITKPKQSLRMEDNSLLQNRLMFINDDTDSHQNRTSIIAQKDLYVYASDTIKGLYRYGNVIPGLAKGFHKILTENNVGTQIDLIYDMYYYERNLRRLYFSYKAGSTYGIDYIDLDDLTTNTTGYAVTEVFTGGTSFKKKANRIRINVSNVDATNTVDLYYRRNNQAWVLLRTINSTTEDIYYRENITTESTGVALKQFIDVQFKVEFTSDNGDNTPPTLHELMLDYDIIET